MPTKERRRHPRIDTDVTVEVYTSSLHTAEPEVAEICTVVNLSESGMRFRAARRFSNKHLLRVTFLLPDTIIIIRTDARIMHLHKGKSNTSDVGVEFCNLSGAEQKLIRHVVDRKLTETNTSKAS